jgi:lactoylglutathione lyase
MNYLHTMIRVTDPDATIAFFELLGLKEVRRMESDKGRFTLIFLAAPGDMNGEGERAKAEVELTYNWPAEDGTAPEVYSGGRNFGHLAYRVDDIYETCQRLMNAGVPINRPPRDGHMAFVRTPDGISIELLQKDGSLDPAEPWVSMPNVGEW